MRALVVLCPHRPNILGAPVLGHVAWGYEYPDGSWGIGAVEGPDWQGSYNGFWARRMPNLDQALHYFASTKERFNNEYNVFKLLRVSPGTTPDYVAADQMVGWIRHQEYNLIGKNCMNFTYFVLRTFANCAYNGRRLPAPEQNWTPNGWFQEIQTDVYAWLPGARGFTAEGEELKLAATPTTPAWLEEELRRIPASNDLDAIQLQEVAFVPPPD